MYNFNYDHKETTCTYFNNLNFPIVCGFCHSSFGIQCVCNFQCEKSSLLVAIIICQAGDSLPSDWCATTLYSKNNGIICIAEIYQHLAFPLLIVRNTEGRPSYVFLKQVPIKVV